MKDMQKQSVTTDSLAEAVRCLTAEVRALRAMLPRDTDDAIKTVSGIARQLGIGQVTCHRLLKNNEIPARQVGGSWLASRAALLRFLAGLPPHPDAPVEHEPEPSTAAPDAGRCFMSTDTSAMSEGIAPAFLRPEEAADYLGMSRRQLYALVESMPGFPAKIEITPRCVGWRRESLDAWLAAKEGTA